MNPELAAHAPLGHACDLCDPAHCACDVYDTLRSILPEYRQQEADLLGVNLDGTRKTL
jgi:hypothetical protein